MTEAVPAGVTSAAGHARIDEIEALLAQGAPVEMPVQHRFTPGLYAREIFLPAGTILTSKIHRTEHPYVILCGDVSVWVDDVGVQRLRAPFVGVTKPGTRRVLYAHADTRWITFHPSQETDLAKLEAELILPRDSLGLQGGANQELAAVATTEDAS